MSTRSVLAGALALGVGSWFISRAARHRPEARPRVVAVSTSQGPLRCTLASRPSQGAASASGRVVVSADESLAVVVDPDNDQVVVVSLGPSLRVLDGFRVGRAPAQLALARDGRLFVAERGENAVSVYDLAGRRRLCRASVAVDPTGLALSPDGARLYVSSGLAHTLTALDTVTFATLGAVDVPREPRAVAVSPDGARVFLSHVAGPALSAVDARSLRAIALPAPPIGVERGETMFRVEHVTGCDIDQVVRVGRRPAERPQPSQAWSLAVDPSRGRVLVPFMVSRTGRDVPRILRRDVYGARMLDDEDTREKVSLALGALDIASLRWTRVALPEGNTDRLPLRIRIPSACALRPRDGALLVVGQGTDLLSEVRVDPSPRELRITPTVGLPEGVVALRDGAALVFSPMLHTLERVRGDVREAVAVSDDTLPHELALGRQLFYSAGNPRISRGGLSCGGCHPDGRDDGLTWFVQSGPRQTPTLSGRLEFPFNWNGSNDTLGENVARTLRRLGGSGLPLDELNALVAWLSRGLTVPSRPSSRLNPAQLRGRALFAGAARCDEYHDPARNFTDGAVHALGGLRDDESQRAFDTPSLRLVGFTAPYFHDGRYGTLRALLTDPRHRMGALDALSTDERSALEAYLLTL